MESSYYHYLLNYREHEFNCINKSFLYEIRLIHIYLWFRDKEVFLELVCLLNCSF